LESLRTLICALYATICLLCLAAGQLVEEALFIYFCFCFHHFLADKKNSFPDIFTKIHHKR
jgi:hypothetical protein